MNFESIWSEYERELSAFVLSRVRDKEIQKEIMQEVAIKIFTSLHSQKEHLRGWLFSIVKNTISDYFRKNSLKPSLFEEEIIENEPHIMQECLAPMINSLSQEKQEVLKLSQLNQYSLKEIATYKNIPLNSVKSKLYRAKKDLANKFFSCCTYTYNKHGEVVGFDDCDKSC